MAWVCKNCEANNPAGSTKCIVCNNKRNKKKETKKDDEIGGESTDRSEHTPSGSTELYGSSPSGSAVVSTVFIALLGLYLTDIYMRKNNTEKASSNEKDKVESSNEVKLNDENTYNLIANTDSVSTVEGKGVVVDVLQNDNIPDEKGVYVKSIDLVDGQRGSVKNLGNGKIKFTPNIGYNGISYVSYEISDENSKKSSSFVKVFVSEKSDNMLRVWRTAALRQNPSFDSRIIAWVETGEKVKYRSSVKDFYRVVKDDKYGYIKESLIDPEDRK